MKLSRVSIICVVGLLAAVPSWGSSIFDDDGAPPPGGWSKPGKPVPRGEMPAPAEPPAPREDPAPKEAPTPEPVATPDPAKDAAPAAPAVDEEALAAAKLAKQKETDQLRQKAEENLSAARSNAEQAALKNPQYVAARAEADAARKKYDDLREIGTAEEKSDALTAWSKLKGKLEPLYQHLVESDKPLKVATAAAAQFGPSPSLIATAVKSPAAVHSSQKSDSTVAPEIADAMARHTLIEGMTFQQACKSARLPFRLMSVTGTTKVYHWNIKGWLGTYTRKPFATHLAGFTLTPFPTAASSRMLPARSRTTS